MEIQVSKERIYGKNPRIVKVVSWGEESAVVNESEWCYEALVAAIVRAKYSADDVEAVVANYLDRGESDEWLALQSWRLTAKMIAAQVFGKADALELAKRAKLAEIAAYDKSESVNGFTIGGKTAWVSKADRVGLVNSTTIVKASGEQTTSLWLNGANLTLPCDAALRMLAALELYALECYNVTERHKAAVLALDSVEEVQAYDHTQGYPQQPNFDEN